MSKKGSPTIFYGWFVVAACFAATFTLGEAMWTFGVFFKPLEKEFGWSRALISSGYTAFLVSYGISVITAGRLADRYSPRPILFISALLAGLGTALCSRVQSINQLRLFLFIGGFGGGATWSVPTSIIQRWFHGRPKAGLALGIVVSGVGVGGLIFAPLINGLILRYGWRNSYLIVGIIFFSIIAISSLIIRPAQGAASIAHEHEENISNQAEIPCWTTPGVIKRLSFISVTFIHCVGVLAFHTVSVHLIPLATDVGISATASAVALGLMGGCSIPGRILAGFISDKLHWQRVLVLTCFGMALSLLILSFPIEAWMLYLFVFLFGMSHGGRVASNIGILSEFFGVHSLGELIGIIAAVATFTAAFAPYIAGFVFDTTGGYFLVFMVLMVFLLSSAIVAVVIKKPLPSK